VDEELTEKEKNFNFQYPNKKKKEEEFEVFLIGENFLIVKDGKGNNIRIKHPSPNFSIGEKIYKEDGKFSWEKV